MISTIKKILMLLLRLIILWMLNYQLLIL